MKFKYRRCTTKQLLPFRLGHSAFSQQEESMQLVRIIRSVNEATGCVA